MDPYLTQPKEVSLETWAKCNAACTFCPYPTMDRIGDKMSDKLIDRLVGEMSEWEYGFYFSPFKVNEPLLDKRTIPLCKRIETETKGIIRFFTNGSALTKRNIEGLAGLTRVVHLWISLNDHRPEHYKDLMNLDFEKTARKLDYLHNCHFPHPVMLSTVGFPNEDFRRYCFDRWPNFDSMAIRQTGWLGDIEEQAFDIPDNECSRWWELSIMASGIASLCCMDAEGQYSMGDLNTQTLLEVYAKTQHWRESTTRTDIHPCNTCNYL